LEQLAKVILWGTLAATVPLYNRNKKQIDKFSESSKSCVARFQSVGAE